MKHAFLFAAAMLVVVSFSSCKKDKAVTEPAEDLNSPMCPVSNSLIDYEDVERDTISTTTHYSYDAQNRVTRIDYGNGRAEDISYNGSDSVIFLYTYNGELNNSALRTFNAAGDHLTTDISQFSSGDTDSRQYFLYSYNMQHQMVMQHRRYIDKSGMVQLDSATNQWTDGNLSQLIGNNGLYYGSESYEYLTNSNGQFIYNTPGNSADYIYNTLVRPVMSKNLVSKVKDANGSTTVSYNYTFDNSGRVKTRTSSNGEKRTFHYKCF